MANDWDNQNQGEDQNDEAQERQEREEAERKKKGAAEFEAMLNESFKGTGKGGKPRLNVGDKIKGEILVLGKEDVFVSTGAGGQLAEGVVSVRDLIDAEGKMPYKAGDVLDLYVTAVKGTDVRLSPKPTAKNIADDLEDAFDMMLPVEGRVAEVCKGGFRVSIRGKLAFCPISQMDIARIETPEDYVGNRFEFRITQFSEGGHNIVVSRRKLLDEQKDMAEGSWLADHKAGDLVDGKIKRLEKFGAFVELAPGFEGLAHISELAWTRVADPSEVVQVGQDVKVKIMKIENEEVPGRGSRARISLSLKEAGEQPWDNLPAQVRAGNVVEGKVSRMTKFGAFIELAPGIEGLLPMGEVDSLKKAGKTHETLTAGQKLMVRIRDVRQAERRVSLQIPREGGAGDESDQDWQDWKNTQKGQGGGNAGLGTLGGAFGDALKKAMEGKKAGGKK